MGCGASTDRRKLGGRAKKSEDPELNGKVKFLSCPSVGEVKHPDNGNKWFLIVFAPQTHHGMIMAARNMKTGKILCKDVKDSEIVQEKEIQKITMSWNLFFKAIASEVTKAGKSGAKIDFTGEESLKLEIKIAITGQAANSRKPDLYKCELTPIEGTPENIYRLFVEPIATFYGKKRTDLLDRPDPQKEKTYGECEANSIVKVASISESEKVIKGLIPQLRPLREKMMTSRLEFTATCSKVALMKAMLAENTAQPTILQSGETISTQDKIASAMVGQGVCSVAARAVQENGVNDGGVSQTMDIIKDVVNSTTPKEEATTKWTARSQAMQAVVACGTGGFDEAVASATTLDEFTAGNAVAVLGYYLMYRYDVVKNMSGIDDEGARSFFLDVQRGYRGENAFHNAARAARVVAAWYYMAESTNFVERARLTPRDTYALIVAVCTHDMCHPGVNNQHLKFTTSRANAIFASESTIERFQSASALALLQKHNLPCDNDITSDIASLIIATDLQNHRDVANQFMQRSVEVSDFGRNHTDRILASTVLLKLADLHHCALAPSACRDWWQKNSSEFEKQAEMEEKCGITYPAQRKVGKISGVAQDSFIKYVASPLANTASGIYPALNFYSSGCAINAN